MSDSALSDPMQRSHDEVIRIVIDGESKWDQRLIRGSYWLNPILVKEARQALKSKQFAWTFMLLIVFTAAWTLFAVASSIPDVYYDSDGTVFLMGYLTILLVPTIIVIPQVAFRSMASELEDGTFETLSLSMLTPGQIVYGKLSMAALQLIVYLSILAPCIAFTYLLRGISLGVIGFLLVLIVVSCMFLAATSIMLAAIARTRTLQVLFSILMVLGQLVAFGFLFGIASSGMSEQNALQTPSAYLNMFCFLGIILSYAWLWLRCAASLIDMASANRSTPVRFAVFVVGMIIAIGSVLAMMNQSAESGNVNRLFAVNVFINVCWLHWAIAGAWMMGESGIISQRARRSLPDSYFGRVFMTLFNPGAGPAYLLVVLGFLGPWVGYFGATDLLAIIQGRYSGSIAEAYRSWLKVLALAAYIALYLGMTRLLLLAFYRNKRASRLLEAFAMTGVLVIAGVFATLFGNLAANNFRDMYFDWYCFLNPFWMLSEYSSDNTIQPSMQDVFSSAELFFAWLALIISGSVVFFINAILTARDVMITRVETPPRVRAEQSKKKQVDEVDPWKEP
jgi:ABC-type Na+ efflux pump permease subunit